MCFSVCAVTHDLFDEEGVFYRHRRFEDLTNSSLLRLDELLAVLATEHGDWEGVLYLDLKGSHVIEPLMLMLLDMARENVFPLNRILLASFNQHNLLRLTV